MQYLAELLQYLGYKPKNGKTDVWYKKYDGNSYEISLSIDKADYHNSVINYGDRIKTERKTTCNLSSDESMVVLECVNRLIS